jgi:flagellar basal-body rod protein FlgB
MNMIDRALGVHPQALELRSRRMSVLAQNIANADTPHFKARDVDFRAVLDQNRLTPMRATHAKHLSQAEFEVGNGEMYRNPFNVAFDGNTVELNVEQAHYGKAAADYQATLNFLEQRVSGMRKALKGE